MAQIYMSRNSRMFTTQCQRLCVRPQIYMSRNSRMFTTPISKVLHNLRST